MKRLGVLVWSVLFLLLTVAMPVAVKENVRLQQTRNVEVTTFSAAQLLSSDLQDVWEGGVLQTLHFSVEPAMRWLSDVFAMKISVVERCLTNQNVVRWRCVRLQRRMAIADDVSPLYFVFALRRIII